MKSKELAGKAEKNLDDAARGYDSSVHVGVGRALLALYWQREEELRPPRPLLTCVYDGCNAECTKHSNYCAAHSPFKKGKKP